MGCKSSSSKIQTVVTDHKVIYKKLEEAVYWNVGAFLNE